MPDGALTEYDNPSKAVSLWLDRPEDIEHSNSAVYLNKTRRRTRQDKETFLIPIGAVTFAPCDDAVKADDAAMRMHDKVNCRLILKNRETVVDNG